MEGGLYLLVTKQGGKYWKLKYKLDGKEKKLSLGAYPTISLLNARELRKHNKQLIANGINPNELKKEKQEAKKQDEVKSVNTFKNIALERLEKVKDEISEPHYKRTFNSLRNDVYPYIGDKQLDDIIATDVINVLQIMMKRNIRTSAKQVYSAISKTFKYAVANGKAVRNPASINEYKGETSVRPSNIRLALWSEIDLKSKQWVIPSKKMKTKDEFIVPLTPQLIELLKEIQVYSGNSPYLFPSTKSKTTPLSDGALLGAIRRMGYTKEEFTPHGFRAMF